MRMQPGRSAMDARRGIGEELFRRKADEEFAMCAALMTICFLLRVHRSVVRHNKAHDILCTRSLYILLYTHCRSTSRGENIYSMYYSCRSLGSFARVLGIGFVQSMASDVIL